jgi:16S rRNA (adenine1518-N6/adenine1519-N6)-dimethyltransferase
VKKQLVFHHGLPVKKHMGQVFLMNEEILQRIGQIVIADSPEFGIEIGAGTGELTRHLVGRIPRLMLLEFDSAMVEFLKEAFGSRPDLCIVEGDARKTDYGRYLSEGRNVVAGNLPYVSAVHILEQLGRFRRKISRIVVLLQQEVAEKMIAPAGSREFGALSLLYNYKYEVRIAFTVSKKEFHPVPKVDSALVILEPRLRDTDLNPKYEKVFSRIIQAAFMSPRKKVLNSFLQSDFPGLSKEKLQDALFEAEIDPEARPGAVTLDHYIKLSWIFARE